MCETDQRALFAEQLLDLRMSLHNQMVAANFNEKVGDEPLAHVGDLPTSVDDLEIN